MCTIVSFWLQLHWGFRAPIVIFLSDGECSLEDTTIYGICRRAVALGLVFPNIFPSAFETSLLSRSHSRKPLSFHAVSFGADNYSHSLRRMAQIAREVQNNAPRDPLAPPNSVIESSYTNALDTVRHILQYIMDVFEV